LAIGETDFSTSLQDDILNCIPMEVPIILMDIREKVLNVSMHQVSMVVMITDKVDAVSKNLKSRAQGLESWNSLGTLWNFLEIFGTFLHRSSKIPDLGRTELILKINISSG
jgi:hypothetical protein